MRQRLFNTSCWPQTSANNQISTFSQSRKFPLFLKFWSLQIFLNKICNQTKHSATTTSLKKSHDPFLDQTRYYQHLLTFSCGFARKNCDNRVNSNKLGPMPRSFFLKNSGSHTQLSNQQHHSIKITPVQFFFSTIKKFDKNWPNSFFSSKLKILSMLRFFTSVGTTKISIQTENNVC